MKARVPHLILPREFQREQTQEKKLKRKAYNSGHGEKRNKNGKEESSGLKLGCFVVLCYS